MSLVERARAAKQSAEEAARLYDERRNEIARGRAVDEILKVGERLGIEIDQERIVVGKFGPFTYEEPLTEDATLVVEATVRLYGKHHSDEVSEASVVVKVKPADQLYWDLPPGVEDKGAGGGTYGCFHLGRISEPCESLADIGERLERIETARQAWRRKHGQEA